MEIVDRHVVIDEVIDAWATALGPARVPYRGHVYRVFNLARRIAGTASHDDKLAVAAAFHDLGIWSDGTFDYLAPSVARARQHVATRSPSVDAELVAEVIDLHHRLRPVRSGAHAEPIEAFRRADLVDVSRGFLRGGLERTFIRDLTIAFPYAGFHGVLVRTSLAWFVKHPTRPMPMLRL